MLDFHPRLAKRRAHQGIFTLTLLLFIKFAVLCLCTVAAKAEYNTEWYTYTDGYTNLNTVVGIDLGNTYTRTAVFFDGRVHVIANHYGHRSTPSWVAFGDEQRLIGEAAKDMHMSHPENSIFDLQRLLGRNMNDESFLEDVKHWPFQVNGEGDEPVIHVQYRHEPRDFTPEEIVGTIMGKMKEMTQAYTGQRISHAVIAVPADFNSVQRQAVQDAGGYARLDSLRIVDEPIAAALAHGLHERDAVQRVLVYDLGGSAFRVSVMVINRGFPKVLATASDLHLGGADFDARMMDHLVQVYRSRTGMDVTVDLGALGKLKSEVERAKRELSTQLSALIEIGHNVSHTMTRAEFEELNMDLFVKTLATVEQVLADSGVRKEEVDEIILMGGSAHIPMVQQLLKNYFNKKLFKGIDFDEVVVSGAAFSGILTDDYGLAVSARYNGYKMNMHRKYGTIIGIDIGNTYSRVGVYVDQRMHIIPNEDGLRSTPSWVSFGDEKILVGGAAKNAFGSNPKNTVFDMQRLLGRNMTEVDIQQATKHWPFQVQDKDGLPVVSVQYLREARDFTPQEISGMLLSKMKEMTEAYLSQKVTHAVVAVPKYFSDTQRQGVVDAGAYAGLNVLRVMNEPTAAAIGYGLDKRGGEQHVLVYDLGGSTFDVSLLAIDDGHFEIMAATSNLHLGGADFDERVMNHLVKSFRSKSGVDVTTNLDALGKLKREAEQAKHMLSFQELVMIEMGSFADGLDFSETLTRTEFEELNADLFLKTLASVEEVLAEGAEFGVNKGNIDEVLLIGGSSRIPKIRQLITEYFGKEPVEGIDPEEAVTQGAAIQGNILTTDDDGMASGGAVHQFITRNQVVPARTSKNFSTVIDNQSTALIRIFEGERAMSQDNALLGELVLADIAPAPRGIPQIQVTIDVDALGDMKISAVTEGTSQSITIWNERGRLSREEIDRRVEDAEPFIVQDDEQRGHLESHLLPPARDSV